MKLHEALRGNEAEKNKNMIDEAIRIAAVILAEEEISNGLSINGRGKVGSDSFPGKVIEKKTDLNIFLKEQGIQDMLMGKKPEEAGTILAKYYKTQTEGERLNKEKAA